MGSRQPFLGPTTFCRSYKCFSSLTILEVLNSFLFDFASSVIFTIPRVSDEKARHPSFFTISISLPKLPDSTSVQFNAHLTR